MSTTGFSSESIPELNMGSSQSIQMTHGTSFEDVFSNTAIMDGFNGISIVLQLVFFLFYAYFQYILSKKLEVKYSWMAWIPILNFFNKLFIAGKSVSWWLKWFVLPIVLTILAWAVWWASGNEWIAGIGIFILVIVLVVGTVKLNHGISTRTGHSGWWTVGLMFAGWLFWPVTALHYEKGDEVTPRPFAGLKKGLLIFFALWFPILMIFGMIAAIIYSSKSVYPQENKVTQILPSNMEESDSIDISNTSITNEYLKRSRDVARISHIWQISTGLSSYYADMEVYPNTPESWCFSDKVLWTTYTYTTHKIVDPAPTNITPGCDGSDGTYAYRSITGEDGISGFVIGARLENERGWNSNLPIDEIDSTTLLIKWSGPYYYIVR